MRMRQRAAALVLCALVVFQLAAPPARSAEYVYFVAAEENILPLTEKTMPFWSGGYLYIASSIITGNVRDVLGISCARNNKDKRIVLYNGREAVSLMFEWEKNCAYDRNGEVHYPGAIYRNGEVFVPAALVARMFGLEYSVTEVEIRVDGKNVQGDLVWIRKPGHVLSEEVFADAASSQLANRYTAYARETQPVQPETSETVSGTEIEGKSIFLCAKAGSDASVMLDVLERYRAQAAFFCTTDFLESQGALLRRMVAMGHSIGILVDGEDPEITVEEQLEAGNRALERATCTRTRLVWMEQETEETARALRQAGYCLLKPDLDRSGYDLKSSSQATNLLRRASDYRGDVTIWLANRANSTGLRAFLAAAEDGDARCLAWTETA